MRLSTPTNDHKSTGQDRSILVSIGEKAKIHLKRGAKNGRNNDFLLAFEEVLHVPPKVRNKSKYLHPFLGVF